MAQEENNPNGEGGEQTPPPAPPANTPPASTPNKAATKAAAVPKEPKSTLGPNALRVKNLENNTTFTLTKVAFAEMQDDTYGPAGSEKPRYKVIEGTPLPRKPKKGNE